MIDVVIFSLYLLGITGLGLFGFHRYFLLYTFYKYKNQLFPEVKEPEEWPQVTVQLPVYNERYVLNRLLKAVVNLDYPKSKLHVQLLDDSTDSTSKLASRFVHFLQKKGYDIDHIRREKRSGFKAGALEYGIQKSSSEYFAVFDADFVPGKNFLKKTVPHIMEPGIGMVQTRWGHINQYYSLLTRLQAVLLNAHFIIEHVARNRSGKFFNFNGTAGIWRRQAIVDAGGWQHDTLTEDLDLSYRSQLAGWKFRYLPDVVSPAELPAEMNGYKSQQHRWAKGAVQTALKLIPRIWRSNFPFHIRLEACIHLCNNFAYLLMGIPAILLVPMVNIQINSSEPPWSLILIYFLVFCAATVSVIVYYGVTIKEAKGNLWPDILYLPLLMAMGIGLSLNNGRATFEALLGHSSEFKRTPKFCLEGRKGTWKRKLYRPSWSFQPVVELLLASYFSVGWAYFVAQEIYYSIPFFLLCQTGFYYISLSSFRSQKN